MAGKPLIIILGPTAVGKTRLAIDLAQKFSGEIINADSRQIYRYMNIGTAKPTAEEQAQAVHHLIDMVDPDENLTLAQYQKLVNETINNIHQNLGVPLLVGGTGQYITAVSEGWSIPEVAPNETLRTELEAYALQEGQEALHQRLQLVDPEAAQKIHPNNVRRVIRAIEVYTETGIPISELQQKHPPPYNIITYGLTLERTALYERADKRVDKMIKEGLLDEVSWLLEHHYPATLPAMSGIGYKQLATYLQGKSTLEQAIIDTKTITHDFIRRQYTWFRKHNSRTLWHNSDTMGHDQILNHVTCWLKETQ